MSRFMVLVNDRSVKFNTLKQAQTYLSRAVPDATSAEIYELRAEARRDQWSFDQVKKTTKGKKASNAKKVNRWGTAWTRSDDSIMLMGIHSGLSVRSIASTLGRTPGAIYNRLAQVQGTKK